MRVEHERDVHPPGPRPHVREVGHPQLVRAEPSEVPVDEVSRPGFPRIHIGGVSAFAAHDAADAELAHESFDGAPGDVVPVAAQPEPELAGTEPTVMLLPRGQDDRLPPLVGHLPRGRRAIAGVVVGQWGDAAAVLGEHGADRLDTPPEPTVGTVLVLPDERDYRCCGRSSSAAKKAEAAFKISLARRNSAFSRRNRLSSSAASLVTPGRTPAST